MTARIRLIVAAASLAAGVGFLLPTWAEPPVAVSRLERDQQVLAEFGFAATSEGALQYLQSLVPVGDPNAMIDALILQLGDDDFNRREQAAGKLLSLPSVPKAKLESAVSSEDAEIRWRARIVLGRLGTTGNRAMQAALRIVAEDPPPNAREVLLSLAALEAAEPQQLALFQTLAQVTTPSDLARLKDASRSGPPFSRLAAAHALQRLADEPGRDALAALLPHENPRVALLAAKTLGNTGDRRSLDALAQLIGVDDASTAAEAANFLFALVGQAQDLDLPSHSDAETRKAASAEIRRWLAAEAANIDLTFPVAEPVIARGDLAGNSLVATGGLNRVVELDPEGKEVWQYDIVSWSAEKLPNGNVLIAAYQANQVLEVNKRGEIVWSHSPINAMRAKPLIDGHILIADFGGHRVVELNEDRQETWTVKTPDNCFDAERLPNGHTVFACPNLVREVDAEGRTVRDLVVDGRVNSVQVLPNGRWLVANFSKNEVQEYDREGVIKWSYSERSPCDAFRLRNGKTLITSNHRAVELSADGKTVREIGPARYGSTRQ